jgi:hypothetical protein
MEQNIRISSHPSLVITADTNASAGAGAVITVPDHMNGDLKPFLLQPTGATVDSILIAINYNIESINRMAHLSSVRATTQSTRSGLAIEAEFLLLNAKLADRAHSLKDAEYKIWELFFAWLGEDMPEEFAVEYETSFSLRDTQRELDQFKIGMELVNDPVYAVKAKKAVAELTLDDDTDIQEVWASIDAGTSESEMEDEAPADEETMDMEDTEDAYLLDIPGLTDRERAQYKATEEVVDEYGAYPKEEAHYMTTNPFVDQGMKCGNCVYYKPGGACEVVQGQINPNALCKLWIISKNLLD